MYIMLSILTICLLGMMVMGVYYELNPLPTSEQGIRRIKGSVGFNLLIFITAVIGLLFMGIQEVMAVTPETVDAVIQQEISIGKGLAIIGIGLPTAFATVGAGIAVGPIGSASLAAISEKPENFGRTLIYLGLAEGIAIYGLVVSILLLGKI